MTSRQAQGAAHSEGSRAESLGVESALSGRDADRRRRRGQRAGRRRHSRAEVPPGIVPRTAQRGRLRAFEAAVRSAQGSARCGAATRTYGRSSSCCCRCATSCRRYTRRSIELRAIRTPRRGLGGAGRDKPELEAVAEAAQAVVDRLQADRSRADPGQVRRRGAITLNFPVRLNGKLAALAGNIGSGDGAPTRPPGQVFGGWRRGSIFRRLARGGRSERSRGAE